MPTGGTSQDENYSPPREGRCEKIPMHPLTRPSATLSPSGGEGVNSFISVPSPPSGERGQGAGVRGLLRSTLQLNFFTASGV